MDGSPSPPLLFPSTPTSIFSRNASSNEDVRMSRPGSVTGVVAPPVSAKEEITNGDVAVQNGLSDGFPGRPKRCDRFYEFRLSQSQLEVQEEFQKLQIQQLQQKLQERQLQLQQTQKLLQKHKHMEVDEIVEDQKRSDLEGVVEPREAEGGSFRARSLVPLVENRENLTERPEGRGPAPVSASNHINGTGSDDFEPRTQGSLLPRCYSVGSSGLSCLHKRPSDVFKRKENFLLACHKQQSPSPIASSGVHHESHHHHHPGHLKHLSENLKRHHRSENGGSFSAPSGALAPIDLTCKRKRSLETSFANSEEDRPISGASVGDHHSILKSVLTSAEGGGGRLRSHTLSVCSLRGLRRSGASSAHAFSDSRKVALAKKNLAPVQRFVVDQLKEIVKFACRQPDFNQLPAEDKRALLVRAGPRLLLLYMAELNFKFAVTLVWEPLERLSAREEEEEGGEEEGGKKAGVPGSDTAPTQRFIETVQNFIVKCQSQSITTDEYFYMRLIVLFHVGSEPLNKSKLVAKQHNEAQQDLQSLSVHKFPSDRLRYSKLLLTIYTLFGIDGLLVENLFYSSAESHRSMGEFLCKELESISSKAPTFQVSEAHGP